MMTIAARRRKACQDKQGWVNVLRRALMSAKSLSSPIVILSLEPTRDIVSLVVSSAEQRRTIMRLSHVSQGFRRTVLDMSWLFTDADWNDWPTPLLDLWCQRARAQPLTICLDSLTLYRRNEGKDPER